MWGPLENWNHANRLSREGSTRAGEEKKAAQCATFQQRERRIRRPRKAREFRDKIGRVNERDIAETDDEFGVFDWFGFLFLSLLLNYEICIPYRLITPSSLHLSPINSLLVLGFHINFLENVFTEIFVATKDLLVFRQKATLRLVFFSLLFIFS